MEDIMTEPDETNCCSGRVVRVGEGKGVAEIMREPDASNCCSGRVVGVEVKNC